MQTIQYGRYGPPDVLEVQEVERPRPARGEVLVRVHAAAVNPKDCLVRKGKFGLFTRGFPQGCGYDLSGEVAEVGEGVTRLRTGDRVFGMVNGFKGRTYAEFVCASENEVSLAPSSIPLMEAAGLPLVSQTALQALRDQGRLEAGQEVCINGASGGVGTVAIQIARALGARVTAVCSHRNLELCKDLGARELLDYTKDDVAEVEGRFDVFFDVFGNRGFLAVKGTLRPRGIYITTVVKGRTFWDVARTVLGRQKAKLVVVKSNAADLEVLAQWVDDGKLRPVVDSIFPLPEAAEAHRRVETKRSQGKVLIQVVPAR